MGTVTRNRRDPDLYTALDLLRELFHIHICFLDSTEAIESFVASYHFHEAQTSITIENIRQLTAGHIDEMVYLTDSFSIQYLLFHFDLRPIVIGPFCSVQLNSNDVRMLFHRYRITDITIQDFFSYYHSLPNLTEESALHMVESIFHTMGSSAIPAVCKINNIASHYVDHSSNEIRRENNIRLLEKRYSYEQKFMLDIEKGNARGALFNLRTMQADVKYLKQIGTTLESEKIGSAITRTTVRLAAVRANLPIEIIDELSRINTIATLNAKNVDDMIKAQEVMIRDFCSAIQKKNAHHYTALVQSILYDLDHNYSREISLDTLCSELEFSKKHIINEFRKQTGKTPMAYLRLVRLRQASILLSGTTLTVQDISQSVGISDSNYFIKLFKKEYGMTPHLYRKQFS